VRVTTAAQAEWQPGFPGRMLGDARLHLFDIPREKTELTAMTVELRTAPAPSGTPIPAARPSHRCDRRSSAGQGRCYTEVQTKEIGHVC
jgi:hypothetical protein